MVFPSCPAAADPGPLRAVAQCRGLPGGAARRRRFPAALVLAGALAGCGTGPRLVEREAAGEATFSANSLLVLSDLDMAATGYADNRLRQTPGDRDRLTLFTGPAGTGAPVRAEIAVSNSVVGWPGALAVSADGRLAVVIETQAEIADDVAEVEDPYNAAPGRLVTTLDIADRARPRLLSTRPVCRDPVSIDLGPGESWAIIGCRDRARPLVRVDLEGGRAVRAVPIRVPDGLASRDPDRPGLAYGRLAPGGDRFAANLANTALAFFALSGDGSGRPVAAALTAPPLSMDGAWLSMGRWSADGRHYLAADTGWGPGSLDAVLNGPGRILSIRVPAKGPARVVSEVRVSLSPEGFDLDPAGTLLAVANMERTYLPGGLPFSLFGRSDAASLSLVRFDPARGALALVDGPVRLPAILPEDVVFDDAGGTIAVLSFQDRVEAPQTGRVHFWRIDRAGGQPRLVPTSTQWQVARGAHDLAVIRAAPPAVASPLSPR